MQVEQANFIVTSGFKDGEMEDCSKQFFKALSELHQIYKPQYTLDFRILKHDSRHTVTAKMKRILKGKEAHLQKWQHIMISCYDPKDGKPCKTCGKCLHISDNKTP